MADSDTDSDSDTDNDTDSDTDSSLEQATSKLTLAEVKVVDEVNKAAGEVKAETYLCSNLSLIENNSKIQIEADSVKCSVKEFQDHFIRIIKESKPKELVELVKTRNIPPLGDLSKEFRWKKMIIDISDFLKAILNDAIQGNVSVHLQGNLKHRVSVYVNSDEIFDYRDVTNTEALMGLVITAQSYPEKWWELFFWDAWLAVTIQLHLLVKEEPNMADDQDLVFPTMWFKNIFDAERLCGEPSRMQYLLLGQDPVSRSESKQNMRKATGIAFHAIRNGNSSISGMKTQYGLNCDNDNPKTHCRNGLLLVNMIRCIPPGSLSVNNNPYHNAWAAYTMKLAHYCATNQKKVVIMCKYDNKITRSYLPAAVGCAYEDAAAPRRDPLLANTPHCIVVSHPSSNATAAAAAATAAAAADEGKKFKDFVPRALRQI